MATSKERDQIQNPRTEEELEENGNPVGDEEEEAGEGDGGRGGDPSAEGARMTALIGRLSVRVHDVVIKGNTRTRDSLIEAEVLPSLRAASTMQELLTAANSAAARLRALDIFNSVTITLDAGPPELPGTANVVIDVAEPKSPLSGNVGLFTQQEGRKTVEGSLKFKNFFGYGDIWDASGLYGSEALELSAGVALPRFKALSTPLSARLSLLSQDLLTFSSYKESLLGLSFGLLSTIRHNLSYDLTWRTLTDPSHMSSKSVRRQLGHHLLSSIKYKYEIDKRDSSLRPTRGYAFLYKSQVGGLGPDSKSLRFLRQEFDLRGAIPLHLFNAALNVGVSAGVVTPWGRGFMDTPSPLPERFFMGGPVGGLGLISLLGFKSRGLGPTGMRRLVPGEHHGDDAHLSPGTDALGGDLAVTAFADLSFDLPLKLLRDSGIHGHMFVNTGNLAGLAGGEYKNFSLRKFLQTFRSSVGLGVVIPTPLFRMEINYCYILKQFGNDKGKTGIQFGFHSPSQK